MNLFKINGRDVAIAYITKLNKNIFLVLPTKLLDKGKYSIYVDINSFNIMGGEKIILAKDDLNGSTLTQGNKITSSHLLDFFSLEDKFYIKKGPRHITIDGVDRKDWYELTKITTAKKA